MAERDKERKRDRDAEEKVGGGPEMPGGDTEPSNWPGEARERGMRPPDPEPVLPADVDEAV